MSRLHWQPNLKSRSHARGITSACDCAGRLTDLVSEETQVLALLRHDSSTIQTERLDSQNKNTVFVHRAVKQQLALAPRYITTKEAMFISEARSGKLSTKIKPKGTNASKPPVRVQTRKNNQTEIELHIALINSNIAVNSNSPATTAICHLLSKNGRNKYIFYTLCYN
jgi:hypothetical protein